MYAPAIRPASPEPVLPFPERNPAKVLTICNQYSL